VSGPRWVKSRGRCHGELLPDGAEMLLEPFGETPPRVGEIAAYINPDGLEVVHRLYRRTHGLGGACGRFTLQLVQRLKPLFYHTR
jgi:hypothetical protein